jgi:CheY-like chemotaxis protein
VRILVADDDPVSSRVLGATLRRWGHEIISASDGTRAWEILRQDDSPKLAILDWCMPGAVWMSAARRARATGRKSLLVTQAPEFRKRIA